MTSRDYDEKIHQLFEEGKKLGAPGINTFSAISNPSLGKNMYISLPCCLRLVFDFEILMA